ncbi:MAG: ABC transporter permease [Clostridia bacterium]|nr:ABC transporter permease [Clostridia bacterium]
MIAIYKRELYSFFTTPMGYVYIAMFWAASSFAFCMTTLLAGMDSSISSYFMLELLIIALMTPLLTMKSFSEERKLKTEQLLLTSPVSLPAFVGAKFLASYTMFVITFLVSCLNLPIMFAYLSENNLYQYNAAIALGSCIALLLVGAAFIALGLLISALTENQMVSAVGTLTASAVLLGASLANSYINFAPLRMVLSWISIYSRFANFNKGYFDIAALIYYASFAFVCMFVTVRIYEKRRWA